MKRHIKRENTSSLFNVKPKCASPKAAANFAPQRQRPSSRGKSAESIRWTLDYAPAVTTPGRVEIITVLMYDYMYKPGSYPGCEHLLLLQTTPTTTTTEESTGFGWFRYRQCARCFSTQSPCRSLTTGGIDACYALCPGSQQPPSEHAHTVEHLV